MTIVYVVEAGEYEQRGVVNVYSSLALAQCFGGSVPEQWKRRTFTHEGLESEWWDHRDRDYSITPYVLDAE